MIWVGTTCVTLRRVCGLQDPARYTGESPWVDVLYLDQCLLKCMFGVAFLTGLLSKTQSERLDD